MKKQDLISALKMLAVPVLLVALGLILILNPDAASAVIARAIGWLLIAAGGVFAMLALLRREKRVGNVVAAAILLAAGSWLGTHPLLLAAWLGRLVGVLILLNSGADMFFARSQGRSARFQLLAALAGVVLILLPMTTSRLVFLACGLVVLVIGAGMLVDRLWFRRRLRGSDDPNIIDAL